MTYIIIDPVAEARYGCFENAPGKALEFIEYLTKGNQTHWQRFILLEVETRKGMTLGEFYPAIYERVKAKLSNQTPA